MAEAALAQAEKLIPAEGACVRARCFDLAAPR